MLKNLLFGGFNYGYFYLNYVIRKVLIFYIVWQIYLIMNYVIKKRVGVFLVVIVCNQFVYSWYVNGKYSVNVDVLQMIREEYFS